MVKNTLKQKRWTEIRTKFAPPYNILFMAELEEETLWKFYIDDIFFLWEHVEEKSKSFIDNINKMHLTITFTADWSKTSTNVPDVTVSIVEAIIETDIHVKSTDSHQYLLSSSCHPFYCKKGIPYSQTLRFNRICSNNEFFDKRCNDFVKYLLERGCSEKMVRKEILRTRAILEIFLNALLEKVNNQKKQNKITFNITCHPVEMMRYFR